MQATTDARCSIFFFTEGNVEESLDLHQAADKTTLYNSY